MKKKKETDEMVDLLYTIQEMPKCDYPNCKFYTSGITISKWGGQLVTRACIMCSRLKVGTRDNFIPENPNQE